MDCLTREELLALPDGALYCHKHAPELIFQVSKEYGGQTSDEHISCIQIASDDDYIDIGGRCFTLTKSSSVVLLYLPEPIETERPVCICFGAPSRKCTHPKHSQE